MTKQSPPQLRGKLSDSEARGVFGNENNPGVVSFLVFETPHRETVSTTIEIARINTARTEEQDISVSDIR